MMLEQSLITHSAPTLAGLKTGSLFCFSYSSGAELEAQLSRCRLALQDKGVRIRILRRTPDRALLYVYRPAKLAQDLQKPGVPEFLAQMGYPSLNPEQALGRLAQKPPGKAAPMRSACFSAIHWPMWWDSLKTKGKTANAPAVGRYTGTKRPPGGDLHSSKRAGTSMPISFKTAALCLSSPYPVPLRPESARKKQTESETKHVLCRDRRKVRLCGGPGKWITLRDRKHAV